MSEETKKTEEQVEATEVQQTEATAEKATEKVAEAPKVEKVNPEEFLANFNWHKYQEGIDLIDEENIKAFETALDGTLGTVKEREVIEGLVVRKTDREAIIDINSKSEGVISLNEFRYNPNLKVGDKVEVLVQPIL